MAKLGVEHDKLVGGRLDAFLDPASLAQFRTLLGAAGIGVGRSVGELSLLGDSPEVLAQVRRIENDVYIVALTDITALRARRTELREVDRRISRETTMAALHTFAAGVTHVLAQKLSSLGVNIELAFDGVADTSREALADALTATQDLCTLTTRLRAYTSRLIGREETTDVADVLRRLATLAQLAASSTKVTLEVSTSAALVRMHDADLSQLVLELVRNAAEARATSVRVRLSTVSLSVGDIEALALPGHLVPGRFAVIEVVDDGPGIALENHESIWHPFFTTKDLGRGLGLSLVHGIAAAYGGAIALGSPGGPGALFRVFLPLRT